MPFGAEWKDPKDWVLEGYPWTDSRSKEKLQSITDEDVGLGHGVCVCVCMCVRVCVRACVRACVCMSTCIHAYVCMYAHSTCVLCSNLL